MSGDGTKAALDLAMDVAGEDDEPEQLALGDLLGLPVLPAGQIEQLGSRRPGRPKGARNKRTTDMAEWILRQGSPPLLTLVRMADMPVDEMAKRLGCSLLEAWQEKRHCATAALPYLHQRQPLAVDLTDHREVRLTIVESSRPDPVRDVLQVIEIIDNSDEGESDV